MRETAASTNAGGGASSRLGSGDKRRRRSNASVSSFISLSSSKSQSLQSLPSFLRKPRDEKRMTADEIEEEIERLQLEQNAALEGP